jgi:uncharacterized membrane protein YphA (DoxX/SURF4 family)
MIPQLQQEAPVSLADTSSWSLVTRVGFRFTFCYFILYVYPRAVGSLGSGVKYSNPLRNMWHAGVPWVGEHVLHLGGPFTEVANGSGDQMYDYVLLFCIAIVAAVATIIWSWLDRKRTNYRAFYQWLRIVVRMVVAVAMISYGANKLYRMQFAEISYARLVDTYAQTSPMGLLWAFMGASHAYSFFGGVGEMVGGLLLILPQFTALGSLITLAVMSNVLMLNLCYDVPRKIYSIHLILMCLFLLLPDMRRLRDLFVLNRTVRLTPPAPLFKDQLLNKGVLLLQIGIGIGAIILCGTQARKDAIKNETYLPSPVRGIWSVEEFTIDNVPRSAPLLTDTQRWQRLILDAPDLVTVQYMDGSQTQYYLQFSAEKKKFTMWEFEEPHRNAPFSYDNPDPDLLTVDGTSEDGHKISAKLRRVDLSDPSKFLLINRGLHWVNSYPFRR